MADKKRKNYLTGRLSDETLVHILSYVNSQDDFIRLTEVCRKMRRLLLDREFCEEVNFHWFFQIGRNSVTRFLKERPRTTIITKLDLSDMYWIPSGIIRDLTMPMISLQTLLAAGTPLLWLHLSQILKTLNIRKLSWSWDNNLEEAVRKRSSISPTKYSELIEMQDTFLKLQALLVHVPMARKVATDLLFYSYSALVYMIFLCQNLEELWLLSWPKTNAERKCSSSFNRLDMEELGLQFKNLHTLVISVKDPPRLSTMSFFDKMIRSFGVVKPAKVFWLDHPLLGMRSLFATSRRNHVQLLYNSWSPQVFSETAERLSYPLMSNDIPQPNLRYPVLKHVLVNHGPPFVVGLNGAFDNSPDIESFSCNALNLRMEWKKFAQLHPKLKAVSISESQGLEDYCVSLAKLPNLQKLSISAESLYEIKDSQALSDYSIHQLQEIDSETNCDKEKGSDPENPNSHKAEKSDNESPLFKKRRVGASSKSSNSATDTRISGVTLLSVGCPKMTELEIGYSKINNSKAGRILPDSLHCIARFKFLRKLSLNGLPLNNGNCLIEICKSCDLESLRLTQLGLSGKCCYIPQLCNALPHCKNLRDFRLEQNYIGSTTGLFKALQSCSDLRRVLIWSSPNDQALEPQDIEQLLEKCLQLTVVYLTIEPTTKSVCFRTRKDLEAKYKRDRPGLSVVLRTTVEEEELINYPSIHYRQLVVNTPQVCQFNDFNHFNNNIV